MKNPITGMLRIVTIAISTVLITQCSQVFAQRVGLIGGLNLAQVSAKEGDHDATDMLSNLEGFHLGLIVDFQAEQIGS